jgi:hypothetical protein
LNLFFNCPVLATYPTHLILVHVIVMILLGEVPHYAISSFLLLPLSLDQTFSSPCSQTNSVSTKMAVFWVVAMSSSPWWWRQQGPLKRW